ncbi:unnamed protein product [Symbiodinium microadriaticum]|nr:unnamed protein product [Symbiodinium microadriaticum]CAE7752918.1 unnamed protein product [Symbiodinium sp. KB8]
MATLLEDAPLITVSVVTLSGKSLCELRLPVCICTEDIYDLTSAAFGPSAKFSLSYEGQLLTRLASLERPFLNATGDSVVVHCTVGCYDETQLSIFDDCLGFGLTSLVRRGRHNFAMFALDSSPDMKDLLAQSENKELLSWVAYTSGGARSGGVASGQPLPGALGLLWRLIRLCPQQVRRRDPETGKLPLHDAAWGHAPFEAAVMLAAAMPSALTDRRNRNLESPHDVGRYVHAWRFSWPEVSFIEARAMVLRQAGQLMSKLTQLRRSLRRGGSLRDRLQSGLRICPSAAARIALFLTDCEVLCSTGLTMSAVMSICHSKVEERPRPRRTEGTQQLAKEDVRPKIAGAVVTSRPRAPKAAKLYQRQRARWPRGCLNRSCTVQEEAEVEHLREHFVKDDGQYGGAHRVRNRRCCFVEVSEITVGSRHFKLQTHVSHTVHQSVQRPVAASAWPSKSPWQKNRLRERWEKKFAWD